jgi:hypothetical protein
MRRTILSALVLLGLSAACAPGREVGKACAVAACDVEAPLENTNTICEPAVECGTLLCVGQGRGAGSGEVAEFCSVDCREDSECPEGFSCQIVSELGENAGRRLCLLPR